MAYSKEKINEVFNIIIEEIEQGSSLIKALTIKDRPSSSTFYQWLENDEEKAKRYARASEIRAERIFEEIIEIADHSEEDHTPFTGNNVIQRDRLKIDARKWMLAKLNPKKYADKIQQEIDLIGTLSIPNIPDIGNRQ